MKKHSLFILIFILLLLSCEDADQSASGLSSGDTYLIAVGTGGAVFLTNDSGSNWIQGTSGTSQDLLAVACNGQNLVAISATNIFTSSDFGENWSQSSFSVGSGLSDIAFGGSVFLITDVFAAKGYYSEDNGVTWLETDKAALSGITENEHFVVYTNNEFVIYMDDAIAIRSADGKSYDSSFSTSGTSLAFAVANNRFYNIATTFTIDGTQTAYAGALNPFLMADVHSFNDKIYFIENAGDFYTSSDGINFTFVDSVGGGSDAISALEDDGTNLFIAGASGNIYFSKDPEDNTAGNLVKLGAGTTTFKDLASCK